MKSASGDEYGRQRKAVAAGVAIFAVVGGLVVFYGSSNLAGARSTSITGITISNGLVGYWPCIRTSSGSVASVVDKSGNGNDGTQVGGLTYATPNPGAPCNFDRAAGQYVALGYNQTGFPAGDSSRSFFAWVKTTDKNHTMVIFSYGLGGGEQLVVLNLNQGGANDLYFSSDQNDCDIANVMMENGGWHLLGFTYSGGGNLLLYVDGKGSACQLAKNLNTVVSGNGNIGSSVSFGNPSYFGGQMEQIRLYNRPLTQSEVSQLFSTPPG